MIDILLATYNGEKYLGELLNSLENQSFREWRLIVADDCSTDRTLEILLHYANTSSHEVEIHLNESPTGQAKTNFFTMFSYVLSPYVMLCDQDDVWLEDKIEKTMRAMHEMEKRYGKETPILVNSDLQVVDAALSVIDNSFFHYSNYSKSFGLREQLVFNKVTGCTVMFNDSLLRYLLGFKFDFSKILMHDSWIALIAQCFGQMKFIDERLILYRQHGLNSVGAPNTRSLRYVLRKIFAFQENAQSNMGHIVEVEHFCEVYSKLLVNHPNLELMTGYAELKNLSRGAYRLYCITNHIFKEPWTRALAQLLYAHK